jgi:hypothetical protein
MGIDCSCMRTDLLEEKTIMIGDANNLKRSFIIVESSEKAENLNETLEKSDGNFNFLNSLCRRYLVKNLKPSEIFEVIKGPLSDYVHEQIKFCESYLLPVSVQVSEAVYRLSPLEIYQGGFDKLFRKSGFGIQVLEDEKYTGNFIRGLRSGYGRIVKSDGNLYEGDFLKGYLEGEGACLEAGIKYRGTFRLGQKFGRGQEDWPDKSTYAGEFQNNIKHGKGKFTWANGNKYKGEFENGNISGKGRFKWKNGNEYKGQWKDNKMHGFGVFKWPDGKIYKGEYFEDKKHGKGTIVWPDQREYEGDWLNGLQHGEGVYKWFNKMKGVQESRIGIWEAGNRLQWIN